MTEKGLKYLSDIHQAIELIEAFVSSTTSYADYVEDLKTQKIKQIYRRNSASFATAAQR